MNIHLLSFFFDLFIWIALGVLIGRRVYLTDKNNTKTGMIRKEINYAFVSVFSGLIAILNYGLPESGFALYDSLFVVVITLAYTLYGSSSFRNLLFRYPKDKKKRFVFPSFMPKGGEVINGNNR